MKLEQQVTSLAIVKYLSIPRGSFWMSRAYIGSMNEAALGWRQIFSLHDASLYFPGGEEYELLIVAPNSVSDHASLMRVGEIVPSKGENEIRLVDGKSESTLTPKGWQPF